MSAIMEQAKQLYAKGECLEALKLLKEVVQEGGDLKEVYTLSAKCLMVSVPNPKDERLTNDITDALIKAINLCSTAEEGFQVLLEFSQAEELWKKKMLEMYLNNFVQNPNKDNFDKCIRADLDSLMYILGISIAAKNQSKLKKMCEEEGMELKDGVAKYENDKGDKTTYTPEMKDEMLFKAAGRVVAKARQQYETYKVCTAETYNARQYDIAMTFVYALIVYNPMRDGDDFKKIPEATRLERLKTYASWKHYMLDAKYTVNGKQISLYPDNDDKERGVLRQIYEKIQELDPSFIPPAMPTRPAPAPASGGCYVATCVYGSYDCPEVWTLRRFRDDTLAATWYGRAFIRTYYAISPTLVKWFGETTWFKKLWQGKLDKMVSDLRAKGVEDTPYQDKNW